jgi:hypothetical protein
MCTVNFVLEVGLDDGAVLGFAHCIMLYILAILLISVDLRD